MNKEKLFDLYDRIRESINEGHIRPEICKDICSGYYGCCTDENISLMFPYEHEYLASRFTCDNLKFVDDLRVMCLRVPEGTEEHCDEKPFTCMFFPFRPACVNLTEHNCRLERSNHSPFCRALGNMSNDTEWLLEQVFSDPEVRLHYVRSQMRINLEYGLKPLADSIEWGITASQMEVLIAWLNLIGFNLPENICM